MRMKVNMRKKVGLNMKKDKDSDKNCDYNEVSVFFLPSKSTDDEYGNTDAWPTSTPTHLSSQSGNLTMSTTTHLFLQRREIGEWR